ncbi:MAG: DUF805 domain-containing protein [Acetobacteraceae bacterium]|nr:DUF805 domain-containing protein [Acetobacteraceae bacterium]
MAIDINQEIARFRLDQWLSFRGRISRQTWWLHYVLLLVLLQIGIAIVGVVLGMILAPITGHIMAIVIRSLLTFLAGLVLLWPALAGNIKRLHDHNLSDWFAIGFVALIFGYQLLGVLTIVLTVNGIFSFTLMQLLWLVGLIVGVAALALLVICGFIKGTAGPNRYGPDPLGGNPVIGAGDQPTVITPRR